MKQLTNVLIRMIEQKIQNDSTNILRVEGIDNPIIYMNICQYFMQQHEYYFIAKITAERYETFMEDNREEWRKSLLFLDKGNNSVWVSNDEHSEGYIHNSFVDFNGAITLWRNEAVNLNSEKTTKLILLLGTELAPDKGGLDDFCVVSPFEVADELKKNYSTWFSYTFEKNNFLSQDNCTAINTLYRAVFSELNIDIFKFSKFIDEINEMEFININSLIEYVCRSLNVWWQIPSVIDQKAVPKATALNKGTLASAKIISDAIKFIQRNNDTLNKMSDDKIHDKCSKYAEEKNIDIDIPFPEDNPIFQNYHFLENSIIEFKNGKKIIANRDIFLKLDYAILNSIIGTRLPGTGPKPSIPVVAGEPIEAYSEMFMYTISEYSKKFGNIPASLIVKPVKITLSNCIEPAADDDINEAIGFVYSDICCFAGGILSFFNKGNIACADDTICFSYEDNLDPFDFENFEDIKPKIKLSGKWGEPCKIELTVEADNSGEIMDCSFKWVFSPYSAWNNAFSYLNTLFNREPDSYILPTMIICKKMYEFTTCESEDEFYAQMEQIRDFPLFEKHKAEIMHYFKDTETANMFDVVCIHFKEWALKTISNGLFNALTELRKVVQSYVNLLSEIYNNFNSYTNQQKEHLFLFVNSFIFTSNEDVFENGDIKEVIFPAYNPIMLEKIDARQLFILSGFKELVDEQNKALGHAIKYKNRLFNLTQLSTITQGADALISKNSVYNTCKNIWSYFCIYSNEENTNNIISNNALSGTIIADDEDATAMLRVSPESNIIVRNTLDYIKTFPARMDGLNIAFISPENMQHIVAAIHNIVKVLENNNTKATLNIKIICLSSKKNSASYLRRWLDNYFSDENIVQVNTFLRYISMGKSANFDELDNLLENHDLCFTYNILTPKKVDFVKISQINVDIDRDQSKFPMSFTPDAISSTHGNTRKMNISHFQFISSKFQTQVSHMICNRNDSNGTYRAVRWVELCDAEKKIIDKSHDKCRWIVCIDSVIDRYMLQNQNRKIIGFTTGEGCYGELNVTVSAREDVLIDVKGMLYKRITEKFKNWNQDRLLKAAEFCVNITKELDGSRILKALNPYDYEIHSFLAYILTLQMLKITEQDDKYIVRSLISLDSYKHWFTGDFDNNDLDDNKRPDFMLIEIPKTPENLSSDSRLKINIKIVECKMGFENPAHLDKACKQLEKGIRVMGNNWNPSNGNVMQRYWLNQLYRAIIFSPINLQDNDADYQTVREKIFGILAGNYSIEWTGDIFAFWLDSDKDNVMEYDLNYSSPLDAELESKNIKLNSMRGHIAGQKYIQKMLLPEEDRNNKFDYNIIENTDTPVDIIAELTEQVEEVMGVENGINKESNIPKPSDINMPFLTYLSDEQIHSRQGALTWFRNYFLLSEKDISSYYDNGHYVYETVLDRIITEFRKANLLENSEVGEFHITDLGRRVYEDLSTKGNCDFWGKTNEIGLAQKFQVEATSEVNNTLQQNIDDVNVVEIPDENKTEKELVISKERNISSVRLLLGEDLRTKEKYYWEFGNKELNNRHLLINGNSGCGKTYCIQALLMEAALQDVSSVVFDYTGGFTNSKLDTLFKQTLGNKIQQRVVRTSKIPMNPFEKHDIQLDEDLFIPEEDVDIATKISNTFKNVYDFGDQQKSAIYTAVLNGLRAYSDGMTFQHMIDELEKIDTQNSKTVLSKIRPFTDINPFTIEEKFNWSDIRDNEGIVYVIQLSGYDRETQILLTELLLWDIWSFCVKNGDENKPFVIVLDEAQNLSHTSDSPSAKILTEGRKFGLSGWYATQFMKPQLSDDEIQRLQQAAQKLYFCPPDDGVMTVAKNIDINAQSSKEWAEHLKKLKKGECVTCGSMVRNNRWIKYEPKIIKITSLQERLTDDN